MSTVSRAAHCLSLPVGLLLSLLVFLRFYFYFLMSSTYIFGTCVCVREVRAGEESAAGCIYSVYTRRPGRCLAEMTAAAALACPPHRPPPTHSLSPSLSCSLMSWQLMFVLEDTHSSLQTGAEGTFQLLRQCLDCCCCPSRLPLYPPSSFTGVGVIDCCWFFVVVVFLLYPGSLCSFAEH